MKKNIKFKLVNTPKKPLWQKEETHLSSNGHDKIFPSPKPPLSQPPHEKTTTHDTKFAQVGLAMMTLANVQMPSINKKMSTF
jgi:hypothetical protein